jgi:hypothetical protein
MIAKYQENEKKAFYIACLEEPIDKKRQNSFLDRKQYFYLLGLSG